MPIYLAKSYFKKINITPITTHILYKSECHLHTLADVCLFFNHARRIVFWLKIMCFDCDWKSYCKPTCGEIRMTTDVQQNQCHLNAHIQPLFWPLATYQISYHLNRSFCALSPITFCTLCGSKTPFFDQHFSLNLSAWRPGQTPYWNSIHLKKLGELFQVNLCAERMRSGWHCRFIMCDIKGRVQWRKWVNNI
jgi:hypothetical protein